MNRRAMPSLDPIRLLPPLRTLTAAAALAALPLMVSACDRPEPLAEAPLAGSSIGGEFTLTDQAGRTRHWKDFRGKYTVMYFGYTFCPDICPTDMQRSAQGLREFAKAHPDLGNKVQQVFVTVDPKRDTQAVVGQFVNAFGKGITGLTGTPEQVKAAADAFKVYYEAGKDEGNGAYLVNHSNVTYLFGPDGQPIATLPTDQGAPAVAAELARWVH